MSKEFSENKLIHASAAYLHFLQKTGEIIFFYIR